MDDFPIRIGTHFGERMTELALRRLVQRAVSRLGARMFRVNVGMAWVGKIRSKTMNSVILDEVRPIRTGLVTGNSDLIGWTTVTVTSEMVGKQIAVMSAIELKTGKLKITREQQIFLDAVRRAGGIAIVARSVEDATNGINAYVHKMQNSQTAD